MNHNPTIMNVAAGSSELDVLRAMYEYQVAATSFFFAIIIFYTAFKFAVWFVPKYWHRPKETD